MKHYTLCTLCGRQPQVREEWSRWQAGQSPRWKVVRHRANEIQVPGRQPICPGSGFAVHPSHVFTDQGATA